MSGSASVIITEILDNSGVQDESSVSGFGVKVGALCLPMLDAAGAAVVDGGLSLGFLVLRDFDPEAAAVSVVVRERVLLVLKVVADPSVVAFAGRWLFAGGGSPALALLIAAVVLVLADGCCQ